jgi:hypothetical protein
MMDAHSSCGTSCEEYTDECETAMENALKDAKKHGRSGVTYFCVKKGYSFL